MFYKNILFSLFLFLYVAPLFLSQQQSPSVYQWLKSFFVTSTSAKKSQIQKAFTQAVTSNKALDLQDIYQNKEQKETFINPFHAADKFKAALKKTSNNNILMARFNNNPQKFLFGASSSSYQYEGGLDEENANASFYKNKGFKTADIGIDFWNRYETDIIQMKNELGINCFRLSIAWERIQPYQNKWNKNAIQKYVTIVKKLKEVGIEPIIVLHHYTIPQWFAKLDGFEKAHNIKYFVNFAQKMYEALHEDVTYWSTFNAIEGYAFKGYYTLDGPPGLASKKGLFMTEKVMYNMLNAHTQVYNAIKGKHGLYWQYKKSNPDSINPQIGIQKNIVLFDPFEHENTSFCERKGSQFVCGFSSLLNNTIFFNYLRYRSNLDWIGVNIYSNMFMLYGSKQKETSNERKTENLNYRDYPEGIYRAVKMVSDKLANPLTIPLIITENGIATKNDAAGNEKRTRFFRRALYTIRKLIEEGYPIIGYTPWASHDNYEWPSKDQPDPYDRPYGLFEVNFNQTSPDYLKRTLKTGAYYYRDFMKEFFKRAPEPIIPNIEKSKTWLE